MSWITGGEAQGCFKATAISLFLLGQIFLLFFLHFAAMRAEDWTRDPDVPKSWFEAYSFTIKGMAYTSAAFMVGVKVLGLFCHGPEVSSLVLQTCNAEAQLEAAYQLFLLSTLFLSSGRWTTEGIRSGVTSLLVIGKVGVANLFTEEKEELKEASFLRKICIATSFLPVFILTTLFKIGSLSVLVAWREGGLEEVFLFLLAVALPAIVLVLLKIRLHLPDMTVTDISQGLVSERVSLHIWPAREPGKRIGLALAALHLVLYSSILAWIINYPDPDWASKSTPLSTGVYILIGSIKTTEELYSKWVTETSTRLHITGIVCLVLGWVTFPMIVFKFFFQRNIVTNLLKIQSKDREGNTGKAGTILSESNVSYVTNNEKVELEAQEEDETKIEALEERERRVMSELEKKLKRRKKI